MAVEPMARPYNASMILDIAKERQFSSIVTWNYSCVTVVKNVNQ